MDVEHQIEPEQSTWSFELSRRTTEKIDQHMRHVFTSTFPHVVLAPHGKSAPRILLCTQAPPHREAQNVNLFFESVTHAVAIYADQVYRGTQLHTIEPELLLDDVVPDSLESMWRNIFLSVRAGISTDQNPEICDYRTMEALYTMLITGDLADVRESFARGSRTSSKLSFDDLLSRRREYSTLDPNHRFTASYTARDNAIFVNVAYFIQNLPPLLLAKIHGLISPEMRDFADRAQSSTRAIFAHEYLHKFSNLPAHMYE